jgi:tRNA-dihydrouridine synthase B
MNDLDRLSPHPVMLAPMVGLTHYAVRKALSEFLPAEAKVIWPTEMLNSRRIPSQHVNQAPEINFTDAENGLCPQLLANEEEFIRLSVPRLEKWGARAIDINMGCPVEKALKHNYGVALMGDPVYAAEIVRLTVKNATVPISVKLRAGSEKHDFEYLVNFIGGLFEAGASWITVHPRTAEQKRKGHPDWNLLGKLITHFETQGIHNRIIGNGDVQVTADIKEMFEATGCARVMVGRALMAKPWLINCVKKNSVGDFIYETEPDAHEQGALFGKFLHRVLDECEAQYVENQGLRRMRFLVVYVKGWVEFGEFLNGRMSAATSYAEARMVLEKFFSSSQRIIAKTTLRS